jgi:hypothetical protein
VRSLCLVALALLWTVVPVPAQMRTASRITVEEHEACSGLSTPQCCEQMVAYHGFRATGDQLSKRGQLTVRLLCGDKAQLASKASSRSGGKSGETVLRKPRVASKVRKMPVL